MSKIQNMSTGAYDVYCLTKRVFFRPVTATTVLKVGQPVCYSSDSVLDHKERASDPSHLGLTQDTYAEGNQEFTGRLFVVEEPLTANCECFAGIVKSLGRLAGADGDMIEIFVPTEGAIVPVWTDIECTRDQTLLGIRNGEVDASYPQYEKIIGVAKETIDRSSTNGLCWMEFKSFIEQGDYTYPALVTDECGGDVIMNHMYYQSAQTAGTFNVLKIRGNLTGAAGYGGGMVQIRAELNAAASDTCQAFSTGLTIQASGELTDSGFLYCNAPLHAGIGTTGTPDLSGGSLVCLSMTYYVAETGGAPLQAYALKIDAGGATYADLDGLLWIRAAGDAGDSAMTADHVFDTADLCIPVLVGTTTYYIPLMNNKGD